MRTLGQNLQRAGAMFSFLFLAATAFIVTQHPTPFVSERDVKAAPAFDVETPPLAVAPMQPLQPQPIKPTLPVIDASYAPVVDRSGPRLQCAIYARQRTGVSLAGAARIWWPEAEGVYRRSHAPEPGAITVMGGTTSGHVAVVTAILSPRRILIDHANWMNQGEITLGALVEDVSANNDWSSVRVWHVPSKALGMKPYPVFGFVHPDASVTTEAGKAPDGKTAQAKTSKEPA